MREKILLELRDELMRRARGGTPRGLPTIQVLFGIFDTELATEVFGGKNEKDDANIVEALEHYLLDHDITTTFLLMYVLCISREV